MYADGVLHYTFKYESGEVVHRLDVLVMSPAKRDHRTGVGNSYASRMPHSHNTAYIVIILHTN